MRGLRTLLSLCLALIFAAAGCAGTPTGNITPETPPAEEPASAEQVRLREFILGVGDTIEISVYRHDDLKRSVEIGLSGKTMYPLIGDVEVAGKGIFALRDELGERLSEYIVNPQVMVTVTSVGSYKILVLGEVMNPGVFVLDTDLSVMEAITRAGGATDDAKLKNVLLISRRGEKSETASLDLKKAFKLGDLSEDRALDNGDIVYVPAVTIANVSWYFSHLSRILSPIVNLESGIVLWPQVEKALRGEDTETGLAIPTP